MLSDTISLSYAMPNKEVLRLDVDARKIFSEDMYARARKLHQIYEQDCLFIPNSMGEGVVDYLADRYDPARLDLAAAEQRKLEADVFGYIDSLLAPHSFNCTREQLLEYFSRRIDEEDAALASDELDSTLALIMRSKDPEVHLKKLLIQFSIEFLSEGSPMAHYAPGAFGPLQANLFRIMLDEMGEGIYEKKHSRLFEGALATLGMNNAHNHYADYFDVSTYVVTDYMFNICKNKKFFLRFLGTMFRNEACFINWQKQLGETIERVFGSSIDRRYFDVHAVVDQDHGRWALDTLVKPALELYGDEVIPEILRGFIELSIYQDLNGLEFCHQVECYEAMRQGAPEAVAASRDPIKIVPQGTRARFMKGGESIITLPPGSRLVSAHDGSEIDGSDGKGASVRLPSYYPVWLSAGQSDIAVFSGR